MTTVSASASASRESLELACQAALGTDHDQDIGGAREALEAHIEAGGEATWLCDDGHCAVELVGTSESAARQYAATGDWHGQTFALTVHCRPKWVPFYEIETHTIQIVDGRIAE